MITGTNALLNQYVPTFFIKNIKDGQGLKYDAVRKAYVNADIGGGSGGADRLGELLDVSPSVDNPLSLQNGQALVYNSFTSLWENKFTDYNTLLNKPTSSSFSFAGLSDTAKPSLPDGYVKWNSTGTQLVYSTTIPAASITGLATVATTGDYNSLINRPILNTGTVTSVGATGSADITVTGSTITTSGTFGFALSNTSVIANTYGSATTVPQFTVDAKGRITNVVDVPISSGSGTGTVTSVGMSGGTTGLTTSGGPITTAGTITLGGVLGIANGGTGATTATDAINALLPTQSSSTGMFLTTDGTIISWATIPTSTGTVTSVSASGSNGVVISGSPITTSGTINIDLGDITPTSVAATGTVTGTNLSGTNTGDQTITLTGDVTGSGTGSFTTTLATVNTTPGVYADAHFVPTITVNEKGLVTSITTQHVDTTVRDLIEETEVITIDMRHQYIVTGTLEVLGRIENNGRIAIL